MQKNDIFEIYIDDLNTQGCGVGKVGGFCVFVQGGVPGDKVLAKVIKVKKSYAVAIINEFLEKSPVREEPKCRFFKKCGGCTLQHVSYPAQLEWKRSHVENCLKRIGGCDVPINFTMPSKQQFRYRNKGAFPLQNDGLLKVGFYGSRSHELVDIDDCVIQSKNTALVISQLKTWIVHNKISVYNEKTGRGLLRHIVVRTVKNGDIMLTLCINGDSIPCEKQLIECFKYVLPQVKSIMLSINKERNNVILGSECRCVFGKDFLIEDILGLSYKISAHSFLQVNSYGTETLYSALFKMLKLKKSDVVADLYCGAGTISLCAAQKCGRVYGVEVVPDAIENAKQNAKLNGIENAEFYCGDAGEVFPKIIEKSGEIDVIIVDPPRKGMDERVIDECVSTGAEKIGYVSCDPATLARDIKIFGKKGYKVLEVTPVDMFPNTTHVETVVLFTKVHN